jgi:hypothetical protein
VSAEDPALHSLRQRLEAAEADLRGMGYQTDRCVSSPGALLGNQRFDGEILLLVLFGKIMAQSNEATIELTAGDRLHVPSGVPFTLRVEGETSAYWIQAFRPDPLGPE